MQLIDLIANEKVVGVAYNANVPGAVAIQLRKALAKIKEEIKYFDELRDSYIKKYGKDKPDGSIGIADDSPHYQEVMQTLNEALATEVEVAWSPLLKIEHFSSISVRDIDGLVAVGLMRIDKDEVREEAGNE